MLQLKTLMNKDNSTVEQVVLQQSVTLQFMPVFLSKFILIYFKNKEVVQRDTMSLKYAMV